MASQLAGTACGASTNCNTRLHINIHVLHGQALCKWEITRGRHKHQQDHAAVQSMGSNETCRGKPHPQQQKRQQPAPTLLAHRQHGYTRACCTVANTLVKPAAMSHLLHATAIQVANICSRLLQAPRVNSLTSHMTPHSAAISVLAMQS